MAITAVAAAMTSPGATAQVTLAWAARYDAPRGGWDEAFAMAVDASGYVYVTGTSEGNGTAEDYATVAYDTNGNERWVRRYDGPGNGWDEALAIAVDGSGNVYVTGRSDGDTTWIDFATVAYDTNGNRLMKKQTAEAIVHLERALELKPDYADARRNLDTARGKR